MSNIHPRARSWPSLLQREGNSIQTSSSIFTSPFEPFSHDEPVTSPSINFFSVPAELRNQIYELVVVNSEHIPIEIKLKAEHDVDGTNDERLQPSLSRVCRQLHNEVLPIYYGKNSFVSPLDTLLMSAISCANHELFQQRDQFTFLRWLSAIGDVNISCITDVKAIPPLMEDWPYTRTFDLIYKNCPGFTMAVDSGPASARHIRMKIDALLRPINERAEDKALSVIDVQNFEEALYGWVRKYYLWKFDDNNAGFQLTFWDIPL